jgi:hypothetical protein
MRDEYQKIFDEFRRQVHHVKAPSEEYIDALEEMCGDLQMEISAARECAEAGNEIESED